jgi:UDP-2,3-diacylglucosamine pyrophosphatase LpxH
MRSILLHAFSRPPILVLALLTACSACAAPASAAEPEEPIRFTSVPDIFNWNIGNPQPGWEDTLDWFFDRLEKEGPDFTLVAGDIMDARWWDDAEQVRRKTEQYWGGFNRRFEDRGMTVYVAPGDHEYGDDGGLARGDIARAFGQEFTRQMGMPRNGPKNHLGRAFYVRHDNLLVVTLDTFEDAGKRFTYTVGDEQLEWMDKVLTEHKDAEFVVVQGHLPIVGPVKSKNSSASMMKGGNDSAVWKLMVKHGVDVYLCGEHHRITVHQRDGIWQVVHGALWGTQTDLNYMRGVVTPASKDKPASLTLELLEFDVQYAGGYIGDHPHRGSRNRPREQVELAEQTKKDGPRVTGTLVLESKANQQTVATTKTGWFNPKK